ncbi:MAG TPA: hypothetical protein DDW28_07655 [Prevotella sp.]|nr:hypothetical protein [uncultured Prevotella sp.]HBF05954.1 hypothetical protein [Candidatus Segatella violae]
MMEESISDGGRKLVPRQKKAVLQNVWQPPNSFMAIAKTYMAIASSRYDNCQKIERSIFLQHNK